MNDLRRAPDPGRVALATKKRPIHTLRHALFLIATSVALSNCGYENIIEQWKDRLLAGDVVFSLCRQTNLADCANLGLVNVNGDPVRFNLQEVESRVGNDQLRSMLMVCGVKTAIIFYEHSDFWGETYIAHCRPGETLELNTLGWMNGRTSSMIITNDVYSISQDDPSPDDNPFHKPVYLHTGINLQLAIDLFHDSLGPAFEDSPGVEQADTLQSGIIWTGPEALMGAASEGYETSFKEPVPQNLLVFAAYMDLDPNWWPSNYVVNVAWYFNPTTTGYSKSLDFAPVGWTLWVESGLVHGEVLSKVKAKMDSGAERIRTSVKDGIIEAINAQSPPGLPFGDLLTSNITRIGWTVFEPTPCNSHSQLPCSHYNSIPPTLILNK